MKRVIFIGDPHFKLNNTLINDVFVEQCLNICKQNNHNCIIVLGGDVLDTHERLHQTPFNKAIEFIDNLRKINQLFILVGNHDYENNTQFLTKKHWMNSLKNWENVTIVDKIVSFENYIFVPYVPPGRFMEALDTSNSDWREVKCIFAHQEFKGCNLGSSTSEYGDKWPLHYPLVISGHIHKAHSPQKNIIYPGSVIQQNFGEENNETNILLIDFNLRENFIFTNIPLNIPKLKTMIINCDDFEKTIKSLKIQVLDKIRIICKGEEENFRRIKKTNLYNNLPKGVFVVFKNNNSSIFQDIKDDIQFKNFYDILKLSICRNKNKEELFKLLDKIKMEQTFDEMFKEQFLSVK